MLLIFDTMVVNIFRTFNHFRVLIDYYFICFRDVILSCNLCLTKVQIFDLIKNVYFIVVVIVYNIARLTIFFYRWWFQCKKKYT